MRFPGAKKGVSKVFIAEILSLIAMVLVSVPLVIFEAIGLSAFGSESMAVVMLVMMGAGAVSAILTLLLKIFGVVQASKDEASFKGVIYALVVDLVVTVFPLIFSSNRTLTNFAEAISDMMNGVIMVLIIVGICNLANQLGDTEMVHKGGKVFRIVIVLAVAALVMKIVMYFFPSDMGSADTAAKVIVLILGVLTIVFSIVQYVLYLSFLSKARKMLEQ